MKIHQETGVFISVGGRTGYNNTFPLTQSKKKEAESIHCSPKGLILSDAIITANKKSVAEMI